MMNMSTAPGKIKREPNGMYSWTCSIDADYNRRNMWMGIYACLIIAVFVLVFGAILSYQYRDGKSFLIVAGCDAVFLLITYVVFRFALSENDPRESYVMSDIYVKSGYGRSSVYFDYDKAKEAVFAPGYIELHGRVAKIRVYAPPEEFEFVRRYIMNRLPGECDIRYVR